jgi:nucleotide-binding universal stress UspA family protein
VSAERFGDREAGVRALCASSGEVPGGERLVFVEGSPGPALLYAAVCHEADLVVVGTKGWSGDWGRRLGDDAAFLAHHVEVPFLAVPAGRRWQPPKQVVVGVDGSEGSLAAVAHLAGLAACAGAGVTAVYACQPLSEWPPEAGPRGWHTAAVHDLAGWTAAVPGGRLRRVVRDEGHPSLMILAEAEAADVDLVVVGSQATNKITHTRPGSTAFQVLQSATRPTLLVPPRPHAVSTPVPSSQVTSGAPTTMKEDR